MKLVFTTGFFDQLNAAHVRFLNEAAKHGALHVGVGSDASHRHLKGCDPIMSLKDRLFLVRSLSMVEEAVALEGEEEINFERELDSLKPDVFVVSDANDSPSKRQLCQTRQVQYVVLQRAEPAASGPQETLYFPYRICLTGGWLDQPWVSKVHPGAVTVLNLEPTRDFAFRCGMATSTRETAKRIWSTFPSGQPENLAKILFGAENPPGKDAISGSQDALGLCLPGFSYLHYSGGYWPDHIESDCDPELARWFETVLYMVPIKPRPEGYDPLGRKDLRPEFVAALAESSDMAMEAAKNRNAPHLGKAVRKTLEAWRLLLPDTVPSNVYDWIVGRENQCYGCGLSGCGGGYLLVIADACPPDGFSIKVRAHHGAC